MANEAGPSGARDAEATESDWTGEWRLYAAMTVAAAAVLWLPLLGRSLELDETIVRWIASGGPSQFVQRSMSYQFTVVGFLPAALAGNLGGGEAALRLPSVLAALAAAFVLQALGRQAGDRVAGSLAGLFLVVLPLTGVLATIARPYTLGLLTVTVSVAALERWLDTESRRAGLLYAVSAGLTAHVHPLMANVFLVHAARLLWRARASRRLPRHSLAVAGTLGALLLLLVPQLASLAARRGVLSYSPTPRLGELLADLALPVTSGALLLAFALASLAGGRVRASLGERSAELLALGALWAVLPPLSLYAVARLTSAKLYTAYYASAALPGFALLLAAAARRVGPLPARLLLVVTTAVLVGIGVPRPPRVEDWRGGAALARPHLGPDAPLVMLSGLVESSSPQWLASEEAREYLNAPATAYLPGVRCLPLPWQVATPAVAASLDRTLGELSRSARFVLMTRGDGRDVERFLAGRLPGFHPRALGPAPGVYVSLFEREAVRPSAEP